MSGYSTGKSIGEWMYSHKLVSTSAKAVSRIGELAGISIAGIAGFLALLEYSCNDDENTWVYLLVGAAGILLMVCTHWLALQLDKRHNLKKGPSDCFQPPS